MTDKVGMILEKWLPPVFFRKKTVPSDRPPVWKRSSQSSQRSQSRELFGVSERKWNAGLLIALAAGIFFLSYPTIADYLNNFRQYKAIREYAERVSGMRPEEYAKYIRDAKEYNQRLARTGFNWYPTEEFLAEYDQMLNFNNVGNMGYIDIPKINVKLPIYHGISDDVLQTSIGHMEQTSLPVGGAGSHCVLSGHRGLPSAKLFSDLDKLTEGDVFTISVLNETYSYEVDQIRVVVPTNLSELKILPGEDLCTLVTCTPYGINTHRLLVRGHRVENANGNAQVVADALQMEPAFVAPFIMIPFLVILLMVLFLQPVGRKAG